MKEDLTFEEFKDVCKSITEDIQENFQDYSKLIIPQISKIKDKGEAILILAEIQTTGFLLKKMNECLIDAGGGIHCLLLDEDFTEANRKKYEDDLNLKYKKASQIYDTQYKYR